MSNLRIRHLCFLFALAVLFSCFSKPRVVSYQYSYIQFTEKNSRAQDSFLLKEISPYKQKLDAEMNVVLAVSEVAMVKGNPEGLLGNFVTDLILKKANEKYHPADNLPADFCILNNGGLRAPLPKGEITRGKVFELMPFENELVVVTLSGEQVRKLSEHIASKDGMPVSGLKIGIRNKLPSVILVNGTPFDEKRNYKIVTSDYLASGGDKMDFMKQALKAEDLGCKIRDAIMEFMKEEHAKGNPLNASLDNRIYYEK